MRLQLKRLLPLQPKIAAVVIASVLAILGFISAGLFNKGLVLGLQTERIQPIEYRAATSRKPNLEQIQEPIQQLPPQFFSVPHPFQDKINKVGMHILNVHELDLAKQVLGDIYTVNGSQENQTNQTDQTDQTQSWHYITVPFTLSDLNSLNDWQQFFDQARKKRIIPLVRLTTVFENGAWQQPTRQQIVAQISALGRLQWPTEKKHIIIFNEVNHAAEWGGVIDPVGYADYLHFASHWAKSEDSEFVILPAAMDLAAPNGVKTTEAFTYLNTMIAHNPDVFAAIDIWNSHSYPNPAFSAPPTNGGQNSLRGFEKELEFIEAKTGKKYPVIITETGWDLRNARQPQLAPYYLYTLQHIWSDSRVLGVTPFILKGDPGPFSGFGFVDANNQPTQQYRALQWAVQEYYK